MPRAPRLRRRAVVVQLFFLGIALILGVVMVWKRVGAQPPPKPVMSGRLVAAIAPASASAAPSSTAFATAPSPSSSTRAIASDGGDDQIDTALLGPDGGVPVHPDGAFRSPFANPTFGAPCEVRVGFVLNDVTQYDIMKGTFAADFYLSLTSDRPMPSMDLVFPNGDQDSKEVLADKPTFKFYRFTGTFNSPPDLRKYPFDLQRLEIAIEENTEGIDQIRLVPDQSHTHLESGFQVIGWDVAYVEARTLVHDFPDRFDHDDLYYGRYEFRLGIERFGTSAVFTVFVPAIVIVLISLMGMWVPSDEMEVRSNAGAPMLAAAVLFHFALMQQLPAVSYLTRADKLMIGVYLSLFLNMLSTWWFFIVEEETVDRVYRVARTLVPAVTLVIMLAACLL